MGTGDIYLANLSHCMYANCMQIKKVVSEIYLLTT